MGPKNNKSNKAISIKREETNEKYKFLLTPVLIEKLNYARNLNFVKQWQFSATLEVGYNVYRLE